MTAFRSLSESFSRLSARERRVVTGGAAISIAALVLVIGVLPAARDWSEREASIVVSRDRLERLQALIESEESIRRALDAQQTAHESASTRLVSGRTPALAASALQALISRYAEESNVTIDRIDVMGERKPTQDGLSAIPLQLSAQGDIHGFVGFLDRLQHGEKLVIVDEVTVNAAGARDTGVQMLIWSLRLRGPFIAEGTAL